MNEQRVNRLAIYNAERARGLLHSDAWQQLMEREQAAYNKREKDQWTRSYELDPGVWFFPDPPRKRRFWR